MKHILLKGLGLIILLSIFVLSVQPANTMDKPRVIVLTDISNEPDDEESMVRFLVYSNEFDVEGLIATTSVWLRKNPRPDLIRRQINAFGQVRDNLMRHASGYPTVDQLLPIVKTGQNGFGMDAVGEGKSTDWCVAEKYDNANHNPIAVINGKRGKDIVQLDVKSGQNVSLSAEGTSDPDGDSFNVCWFVYPEAGSYGGQIDLSDNKGITTGFTAPEVKKKETIHYYTPTQR